MGNRYRILKQCVEFDPKFRVHKMKMSQIFPRFPPLLNLNEPESTPWH